MTERELFAAKGVPYDADAYDTAAHPFTSAGTMAIDEYSVAIVHTETGPDLRLYSEVSGPLRVRSTD